MLFSIRKKIKIQICYYRDKLGSWQVLRDFIDHDESNIPESWRDILKLKWKIRWTLHDLYTVPHFDDITDIIDFMGELEWEDENKIPSDFKREVVRDLILAFNLAVKYLEEEWYHLPNGFHAKNSIKSKEELFKKVKAWQKFRSTVDKIGYCTVLKEVLWFFRIIRYKRFRVNYTTWDIDVRDIDFINSIISCFDGDEFSYQNRKKFSSASKEAKWQANIDWRYFEFYAWFDIKTIRAMIEKMDGQEKYNLPEAFKDVHRMRIEVPNPETALSIWRIIYEKLWWWFTLENDGNMLSEKIIESYIDYSLFDDIHSPYKESLQHMMRCKKDADKAYRWKRSEFKITRPEREWLSPLEVQIVLVNNQNETWFNHHDIYKIRRKIMAKIRRHWWIWNRWIDTIIDLVYRLNKEMNNGTCTIWIEKPEVKKHILAIDWFLIPIRWASEWEYLGDISKLKPNHWTTKEVLEKFSHNYPNVTKRDPIFIRLEDSTVWLTTLAWISKVFPTESSSPSTL